MFRQARMYSETFVVLSITEVMSAAMNSLG